MTNTDTPRTNAVMKSPNWPYHITSEMQKMERELAASQAEVERLKKELTDWDYGTRAKREQERAEKAESDVERLKQWKDNLISNLMALEIYEHKHSENPAVALASYGQWNFKHGEWEAQAEVERLREQLESTKLLAVKFWSVLEEHGFELEINQ